MIDYRNITYYDKFKLISEQKSKKEKIELIKKFKDSDKGFTELVCYTFDENIWFLLPEGVPPYTPSKELSNSMIHRLNQEMRRIPIFLNYGPYPNMDKGKRESLFIDILGSIHPDDAVLLSNIKDKKLPFDNLNRKLFEEVYDNIKSLWVKREDKTKGDKVV